MKVVQICIGKFHHFDLARELHARGFLEGIFTGYPRWKLRDEGLPQSKIKTFPWLQTIYMGMGRYNLRQPWLDRHLACLAHETLSRHASRRLGDGDIVVALSGQGLEAGQTMQRRGGHFVCDRASSHIRYQDQILREEFARWGAVFPGVDERGMNREENEYASADMITVPSAFARRSFIQMGVAPEKVQLAPFGVELRRFSKVASPAADEFQVLFVGQVSFRKGVPYLLEAFRQFRHPRKRLVIIGSVQSEILPVLRGLPANVQVLGPKPQPELKEWMSRSHVMMLPSIEEGLAYVQAQAMACGCPVIGTSHTGAEDLFTDGHEGFIVPIRDIEALRDRLEMLTESELRERMSHACLSRVLEIGGWRDYGKKYIEILKKLKTNKNI